MQPTVWPVGLKKQVTQWLIAVCYLPSRWVQSQLVSCMCVYLRVCDCKATSAWLHQEQHAVLSSISLPLEMFHCLSLMNCVNCKCLCVCVFSTLQSFMEPSQSRKTFLFLFKKIWFVKIKKPNHVWDFGVLYLDFWWVARPRAWHCVHVGMSSFFCFFYSWIYVNMNRFKRTKCLRTHRKNESK